MTSTPFAMFGSIALLVRMQPSEIREVTLGDNGLVTSGLYYYTDGCAKVKVKETGEVLQDRTPGWLNAENANSGASTGGTVELTFPVETEWLCIPHEHNPIGLPDCSSIILAPGEVASLPQNANVFLVRGTAQINGKSFIGPWQIRVRSGDVELENNSNETIYALRVISPR